MVSPVWEPVAGRPGEIRLHSAWGDRGRAGFPSSTHSWASMRGRGSAGSAGHGVREGPVPPAEQHRPCLTAEGHPDRVGLCTARDCGTEEGPGRHLQTHCPQLLCRETLPGGVTRDPTQGPGDAQAGGAKQGLRGRTNKKLVTCPRPPPRRGAGPEGAPVGHCSSFRSREGRLRSFVLGVRESRGRSPGSLPSGPRVLWRRGSR